MASRLAPIAVALAIAAALVANTFFAVTPRTVVLVTQFGRIVTSHTAPGLYARVPFLQSIERFDSRTQTLDGDAASQDFTTADHRDLSTSYYVKWRLADAVTYFNATGGQDLAVQDRLSSLVKDGLQSEFSKMNAEDAGVASFDGLSTTLAATLHDRLDQLGLQLVDVRVISVALPKELTDSRYSRMRAERKRVASELRAQGAEAADKIRAQADTQAQGVLAEADRQSAQVRGEADAQASHLYSDAYSKDPEFFNFFRSLEAYRNSFQGNQDVIVLKPDSEFFRYFSGSKAGH